MSASWISGPPDLFLPPATKTERNAQIVARIKAGEKRSSLAVEFGINRYTVTRICKEAGLPRWSRFKRPA